MKLCSSDDHDTTAPQVRLRLSTDKYVLTKFCVCLDKCVSRVCTCKCVCQDRYVLTKCLCLRLSTDKASIAQELLKLQQEECNQSTESVNESVNESTESYIRKVIIFDRMAVINRVDIKEEETKTCDEFAASFIKITKRESLSYNEVRIIFDRYTLSSLKTSMRTKQTDGTAVRYKVTDKTNIEHLTTKQLLVNIETKNDLTMFLAEKVEIYLNNLDYVVVYGNIWKHTCTRKHYLEADTGIVLHALDVSERDPFTDPVISCSDTDVLLILLFYHEDLCSSCIFKTRNNDIKFKQFTRT